MSGYIDADHFRERFDMMCDAGGALEPLTRGFRETAKMLIDLEPKFDKKYVIAIANWEYIAWQGYRCTNCKHFTADDTLERFNYCPYCGARIDKSENSKGLAKGSVGFEGNEY